MPVLGRQADNRWRQRQKPTANYFLAGGRLHAVGLRNSALQGTVSVGPAQEGRA